jgi:hypothetical protein
MKTVLDGEGNLVGITAAVVVFDLLGYKNFMEANGIVEQLVASEDYIEKSINLASSENHKFFSPDGVIAAPPYVRAKAEEVNGWQKVESIYLMDSIVLYAKVTDDPFSVSMGLIKIMTATNQLFGTLMVNGFPSRNAIAFGSIHVKRSGQGVNVFGEAFLEAYTQMEAQNWIGGILAPSALAELNKIEVFRSSDFVDFTYPNYAVPTKEGAIKCRAQNWPISFKKRPECSNIEEALTLYCGMHNKQVDDRVKSKIIESSKFYRFCLEKIAP